MTVMPRILVSATYWSFVNGSVLWYLDLLLIEKRQCHSQIPAPHINLTIFLQKNLLDASSPEIQKLTEMMLRRDPFYKAPATPDPDMEAEKAR